LVNEIVDHVKADGWQIVSHTVPKFLRGPAEHIYNDAFKDLEWVLDQPLKILSAVAGWINDAVMLAVGTGDAVSKQSLKDSVQAQLKKTIVSDLTFTISIRKPWGGRLNLGRITLPGAHLLARISSSVLAALEDLLGISGGVVDIANHLSITQRQLSAKQAVQAIHSNQPDAAAALNRLKTGRAPTITIATPGPSGVYDDEVELAVTIAGINDSFLSATLGVPRRVRLYFNGKEYDYSPQDWSDSGGIEKFNAKLVPTSKGLVARPASNVPWTVQLHPAGNGTWIQRPRSNITSISQIRKLQQPILKTTAPSASSTSGRIPSTAGRTVGGISTYRSGGLPGFGRVRHDQNGTSVWYGTPDAPAPQGEVLAGRNGRAVGLTVTVAARPMGSRNSVEVRYRISGGAGLKVPASLARTDVRANAQYFIAHLPEFRSGDHVEYIAVLLSPSNQVPDPTEAKTYSSSFRVVESLSPAATPSANLTSASPGTATARPAPSPTTYAEPTGHTGSVQMMSPGDLLAPVGPTIVLRPGLNTLQVVVAEGDDSGTNIASAFVPFFLKNTQVGTQRRPRVLDHRV
jgi:hypothetical protein